MRTLLFALTATFGVGLAACPVAEAKKKKPSTAAEVKKKEEKPPPPGDKSQNEGAQGRKNATEDAARSADSPQWERRP
jgi:hypothetical protein